MTNADQVLVVGSIDCNDQVNTFLVSFSLGKPSRAAPEYGGPTVDVAAVGELDTSALVESHFVVQIKAGSVDAVMALRSEIAAELRDLKPITVGIKNSAHTGLIVPKIAECIEIPQESPWDSRLVNANSTQVEIIVRRDPYIRGDDETFQKGTFALPAVLDLSGMSGDGKTPVAAEVAAAAGETIRSLWAGVYPEAGADLADFVRELHAATWTGSTAAAADAVGWPDGAGDTVRTTTSATLVTTSVDTADFEPGEYLVLVRAKANGAGAALYAGPSAVEAEMLSFVITDANYPLAWYPLGVVSLPAQRTRSGSAAPLYVGMKSNGSVAVSSNAVAFVPTSWSMVSWRDPASHCHTLNYEDCMVYADDLSGLAKAGGGSRELRALGGTLVAVGGPEWAQHPTLNTSWRLSDTPRWEQLPAPRNDRIAFTGDSFIGGVDPANFYYAQDFATWAQIISRKRLDFANISTHPGQPLTVVAENLEADVLAYEPGWTVVEGSANGILETYSGEQIWVTALGIYERLLKAGSKVIACPIVPNIYCTAPYQAEIDAYNALQAAWVAETANAYLCDWYDAYIDPADGFPYDALTVDGVHPNMAGAIALGNVLAQTIATAVPDRGKWLTPWSAGAYANLASNPDSSGDAGTGLAWYVYVNGPTGGAVTNTKVPRTDGKPGEWQQVNVTSNPSWNDVLIYTGPATEEVVPGATYVGSVEFECDAGMTLNGQFMAQCSDSDIAWGHQDAFHHVSFPAMTALPTSGVFLTPPYVAPPDLGGFRTMQMEIHATMRGKLRVGRWGIWRIA